MSLIHRLRAIRLRSSALIGALLIVASIVGVNLVIRANNVGDPVLLAAEFLPAGTTVTDELIVDARLVGRTAESLDRADVIGRVLATDVGAGELITGREFDETLESDTIVAIPLGVAPADSIAVGSTVSLWDVDSDGIRPPVTIAGRATLLDVAEGSLGSEARVTVLLSALDVDRVLGALGSTSLIVATSGQAP